MAIAAVLPRGPYHDRDTSFTVIGVTAPLTIAMVAHPIRSGWVGFLPREAGIYLGGTTHDVAQVAGAGYSLGKEAGDTATIVKLMRVALLLPVIVILSVLMLHHREPGESRPSLLPWFAPVFALPVALNSLVSLPQAILGAAGDVSRFALFMAISASGMKTSLKDMAALGWKPVALMIAETLFLAGVILALMKGLPP